MVDHVHRPTAGWLRRLSRQANGGRRNRHEPNASAEPTSGAAPNPCPFKLISARADPLNEYFILKPAELRYWTRTAGLNDADIILADHWLGGRDAVTRA